MRTALVRRNECVPNFAGSRPMLQYSLHPVFSTGRISRPNALSSASVSARALPAKWGAVKQRRVRERKRDESRIYASFS